MAVQTQSTTVVIVAMVFAITTFVILVLRIYARACLVKHFGTDDYLIIVASLFSWAFIAATIRSAELGLGSHFADVMARGTPNLIDYLQTVWLSSVFYNACLGLIKTSVLALYTRLGDGNLRVLSFAMMGVVGCQATANVLVCIFQCQPIQAAYDITIGDAGKTCIDINAFYLANAAVNILTDILTYALPIPLVLRLQLPRVQRIGLGVILSLGFVACLSSIIRITFIPAMLASEDPTWDIAQPMYWSVIEINIGIMASSIPSTKIIAKRHFPRLLGSSRSGTGLSDGGFRKMGTGAGGGGGGGGGVEGSSSATQRGRAGFGCRSSSSAAAAAAGSGGVGGTKSSCHRDSGLYYTDSLGKEGGSGSGDDEAGALEMVATLPGSRMGRRRSEAQLSDEEALTGVPEGRIAVTTRVQMHYDDQLPSQGR